MVREGQHDARAIRGNGEPTGDIMKRESKRIRVVIVDDHDMLREGLAVFLKAFRDMQLVGEAASGEDAVRLCTRLAPDVVLMDLVMSGMGGVESVPAHP